MSNNATGPLFTTDGLPFNPFGPDETCKLNTCNIKYSIFTYRPSLAANAIFLVLYSLLLFLHVGIGIKTKSWAVSGCIWAGCVFNIIGYAGRILMWQNPFSYPGFILQILFVGSAPVLYSAAIYITVAQTFRHLDESLSRVTPKLYYAVFIPSDVLALVLQAGGGILSTIGDSKEDPISKAGVDLTLAGLSLQVATMAFISVVIADFMIRYYRQKGRSWAATRLHFKLFISSLSAATLLILVRCGYRVAELGQGYDGRLYHEEIPFIVLEGVLVFIAVLALAVGHPGLALRKNIEYTRSPSQDTMRPVAGNAIEMKNQSSGSSI
ncbi:parasitic phase-specific protein PSP-1 [Xylariaceae sp. FL1019]|nr:parasitic phase-specific protein PSP-1 [Xylariaceae sp. FL1019]